MEVVSQEVCTSIASMAVEHSEKAALGPVLDVLLRGRLHDVQYDTHSVLVVVSDDTLVGVRSVTDDVAVLPHATLSGLPAGEI